jgi:hypothetical protein
MFSSQQGTWHVATLTYHVTSTVLGAETALFLQIDDNGISYGPGPLNLEPIDDINVVFGGVGDVPLNGTCFGMDSKSPDGRFSPDAIIRIVQPGDINGDRAVDAADAGIMFSGWGVRGPQDVNGDGITDAADAGILFSNWTGDAVATLHSDTATVGEPSGWILALAILIFRGFVRGMGRNRVGNCCQNGLAVR